ncbi:hypothetical protein CC85DRAFT_201491 [Cutaneotrichosporon oleaginosum]|uniref:BTB domain-containing protein n=1 Tax=Cutaneotrichosporon oleaginosum TaxID=879819 RepID=A0A0J0XUA5_9TREE|nr:uncharacterized protein CC85DRAFT_201491 [Cutaneotrichosporon oleaginosum]KLT44671.1 hypothetical protein CC85DRAFT_201491 [Cutaneotrichosporon oleaginosum]TXT07658.1 hypothetical protein COLE_04582 [Cutaneotrichosporon oleaginosum]
MVISATPQRLYLVNTHSGNRYHHCAPQSSYDAAPLYNMTTPLPLPYIPLPPHLNHPNGCSSGHANVKDTSIAYLPQPHAKTNNAVPVQTPAAIPPAQHSKDTSDTHFCLSDGKMVPVHSAWTRGDFVLVTQYGKEWQAYRVHASVLSRASPWLAAQRGHVVLHEPPDTVELFLAFLYLGRGNISVPSLAPSLEQYHALHSLFVRLGITRPLCLVVRQYANSYAVGLVESLGRTAAPEQVWRLLDLARLLRAEGVWSAALDTAYETNGWKIILDPWDAVVEPHNAEAHAVLLLLHRMSALEDAPLNEFCVAYDTCE